MDGGALMPAPNPEPSAFSPRDFRRLSWLARHLPADWIRTRRRRRFLFLGLAAPGFFSVFGTIYHHNFFVLLAGFVLFGAAVVFRARTEPTFVRAEAADLWPPSPPASAPQKDHRHA
ncbi:hypothetical protein LJR225_005209 [Phenylobacterium sp. LjRoot225]|uniref:hypothetical protein n=1 Tax=Phenylobacterium sp. LjRoot225 TaxID=3342285 RepID=UPI003ED0FA00